MAQNSKKFSLATVSAAGCRPFAAVVLDDRAMALGALCEVAGGRASALTATQHLRDVLDDWDENFAALSSMVDKIASDRALAARFASRSASIDQLTIHAPIAEPRQIFCIGANYRTHVMQMSAGETGSGPQSAHMSAQERAAQAGKQMDERKRSGRPYAFLKAATAICGPFDDVEIPTNVKKADWEVELGVVIGRRTRNVPRERALEHVAGYVITNDLSARDFVFREEMPALGADWLEMKSKPGFMPSGPFLVPAAFVPDPQDLQMTLKVNGELMQDGSTGDMIFPVDRQIEYLSEHCLLLPGDIISTGSPAGNASHHGNRYLQDGDLMEGSISGLGEQRSRFVKAADGAVPVQERAGRA